MKTIVQCKCVAKTQKLQYSTEVPMAHVIELEVPYEQTNIFWKLSGGTNLSLNTINQEAADMFIIGNTYEIAISPVQVKQ